MEYLLIGFFTGLSLILALGAPSAKIKLRPVKKPINKYSILNFLINN